MKLNKTLALILNWDSLIICDTSLDKNSIYDKFYKGALKTNTFENVYIDFADERKSQIALLSNDYSEIFNQSKSFGIEFAKMVPNQIKPTTYQELFQLIQKMIEISNDANLEKLNCHKILILPISDVHFDFIITNEFVAILPNGSKNVSEVEPFEFMARLKSDLIANDPKIFSKYDEIIVQSYPNQKGEVLYYLGANLYEDNEWSLTPTGKLAKASQDEYNRKTNNYFSLNVYFKQNSLGVNDQSEVFSIHTWNSRTIKLFPEEFKYISRFIPEEEVNVYNEAMDRKNNPRNRFHV